MYPLDHITFYKKVELSPKGFSAIGFPPLPM